MSQETIEIAGRRFEQFTRQFTSTEELDLDPLASNVVLDNSNAVFEGAVYHGHDGMRELGSTWRLAAAHGGTRPYSLYATCPVHEERSKRDPYWICTPEIARAITSRWISDVPSKIV